MKVSFRVKCARYLSPKFHPKQEANLFQSKNFKILSFNPEIRDERRVKKTLQTSFCDKFEVVEPHSIFVYFYSVILNQHSL